MNGYPYHAPFVGPGMDQSDDAQDDSMMMMDQNGMALTGGMGGQSLDDIVSQNAKMMRRQSVPQGYHGTSPQHVNADLRRVSMMDYTSASPTGSLADFQYAPGQAIDQAGFVSSGQATPAAVTAANSQHRQHAHSRRQSANDLSLNTHFANNQQGFTPMMPPNSAYAVSPAHPQSGVDLSAIEHSPYLDSAMGVNMDYGMDQNMSSAAGGDAMSMNLYNQPQFNQSTLSSPMHPPQGTPQSGRLSSHDQAGNSSARSQYTASNRTPTSHAAVRHLQRTQSLQVPEMTSPAHTASPLSAPPTGPSPISQRTPSLPLSLSQSHSQGPTPTHQTPNQSAGFLGQPQNPVPGSINDRGVGQVSAQGYDGVNGPVPVPVTPQTYNPNNQNFPWEAKGVWPSTMVGKPHMNSSYKNAYSSTGFDMLGVLVSFFTVSIPQHMTFLG